MRVFLIAVLLLVASTKADAQNVDTESLPSLRQALLESYESMEAAKAKLEAAEKQFAASEEAERTRAVELLTKIAKKEVTSGDLAEAKKVYTKVLELRPYNKDAEQFFMSTGAGDLRRQIIVDQMVKNSSDILGGIDLRRAKTWIAVARDLDSEDSKLASFESSIDAIENLKQAIINGDIDSPVSKDPIVGYWRGNDGTLMQLTHDHWMLGPGETPLGTWAKNRQGQAGYVFCWFPASKIDPHAWYGNLTAKSRAVSFSYPKTAAKWNRVR